MPPLVKALIVLAMSTGGSAFALAASTSAFQIPDSQLSNITVTSSTPVEMLMNASPDNVSQTLKQLKQYTHYEIDPQNAKDISIDLTAANHFNITIRSIDVFRVNNPVLISDLSQTNIGIGADLLMLWNNGAQKGFNAAMALTFLNQGFDATINEFGDDKGADILLTNVRAGNIGKTAPIMGDFEIKGLNLAGTHIHAY